METNSKKTQFDRFSGDFSEDVRKALWDLLECQHFAQGVCMKDGNLRLDVSFGAACVRYLTLQDVSGVPEEADELSFESLIKRQWEYRLVGEAWNEETEELRPFTIRFLQASVETIACRADEDFCLNSPWGQLTCAATGIMEKYSISEELLNDGEKDLLPLLAELAKLAYTEELAAPWNGKDFPHLKARIIDSGYPELIPAVENVEKNFSNFGSFQKLFAKLNQGKYEPLFRELWNRVLVTQQDYPTLAERKVSHIKLVEIRKQVTRIMEERGYSGTYPDFYKTGEVKGLRMVERQGVDYFVCGEKRAVFHIHCQELIGQRIQLMLYCGTQLLRKDQQPGDILSCMFDTRGRTFAKMLLCEVEEPGRLETVPPIADKLAQLKKLTREERKELHERKVSSLALFLGFLILGGFAFAVLCVQLFMGIDALSCWQAGEPVVLSATPWLQIFFATWLAFGSLTGALIALINFLK